MKKKYLIYILFAAILTACTEDFDDYNVSKKLPGTVPGNALFASGQLNLVDQMSTPNVNNNIFRLIAQYWTETTYTDEANYDLINRTIPDLTFQAYYRDALKDFSEAALLIAEEETVTSEEAVAKQNRLHIIELMMAYAYQRLVDIFGDVPYSEAVDLGKILPKYDDSYSIYQDLIARVNTALAGLDDSGGSFGDADIINGGDVASWITFGNTLKLKLGIMLADHNDALAQSTVESALAGVISSNDENILLHYLSAPPNSNPVYDELVLTGRKDFVAANTIVDIMNAFDDPRLPSYFTLVDTSTETGVEKLAYKGGVYGASSPYALNSHVAPWIIEAGFPGILFTYDEVCFFLAEAAERGYNVPMTAEEYYDEGIRASFDYWGAPQVSAYLAKPEVNYATASGTWKQKIGLQSWLAFYTRGLEGWTQWRKLDYPNFAMPPEPFTDTIPKRFTYPVNEQTLNPDNYAAAAAAMGGDIVDNRIFWDKY